MRAYQTYPSILEKPAGGTKKPSGGTKTIRQGLFAKVSFDTFENRFKWYSADKCSSLESEV